MLSIELTPLQPTFNLCLTSDYTHIRLAKVWLQSHLHLFDWASDFAKVFLCLRLSNRQQRSVSTIWHPFNELSLYELLPVAHYNECMEIPDWATHLELSLLHTDTMTGHESIGVLVYMNPTKETIYDTENQTYSQN